MWLFPLALACFSPRPLCDTDDTVLAQQGNHTLDCRTARRPARLLRVLVGQPLPSGTLEASARDSAQLFERDPQGALALLEPVGAVGRTIEQADGMVGAGLRAQAIWQLRNQQGPLQRFPSVFAISDKALRVLVCDDTHQLCLTEVDVEGWIQAASLLHEVQGGGVLRLSIANRAAAYDIVTERFRQAERDEQIALTSLGTVWPQVVPRWKAASYDIQQAWIRDAATPPPGERSHLAYFEAVMDQDVVATAAAVHRHLGPLHVRDGDGYFGDIAR